MQVTNHHRFTSTVLAKFERAKSFDGVKVNIDSCLYVYSRGFKHQQCFQRGPEDHRHFLNILAIKIPLCIMKRLYVDPLSFLQFLFGFNQ